MLRGFLTYTRVECGLSHNTVAAYQRDCEDLLVALNNAGRISIADVTPRYLSDHLALPDRWHVRRPVVRHLATIRTFFKWAMSTGLLRRT